jgi:glycosyltransferase involved in cell wall biosynthesis
MKKILFLNYEYPPLGGGAANATKYILQEYAKKNDLQVDLITSAIGENYSQEKIGSNITIHRLPIGKKERELNYQTQKELIFYTVKAYFFARKLIKKNNYDLSHSFFAVPTGVLSLLFKWQFKLSYIVSLRGSDVPNYSERFAKMYKFLTPIIKLVWKNAVHVVTNSKGLTELAKKSAPQQKFLQIFNGVDTEFYQPGSRTEKERREEFKILLASRLSKRKGFRYAIKAFAKLQKKYSNISMVIAGGEGNAMTELREQVAQLKLKNKIKFTGAYLKKESPRIYTKADVFVMPSFNEGMSNNLLEAMASGLPVLMTPTGGAEELIKNGENGYLIKMKDVDSIVKKLEILINNPQKCEKLGRSSRRLAETLSWKSVADKYIALYNGN